MEQGNEGGQGLFQKRINNAAKMTVQSCLHLCITRYLKNWIVNQHLSQLLFKCTPKQFKEIF